ncbi:toxic anion resistance protein [Thermoclostridium stercorarium]|uniref:toxic anion resistance protein n=1 Tax=Thermoclostridium stercorarium TaxID=1510 RepID=UPI002248B5AB|nr:toxic anion resistance protein [Thermoclostridium stercorarium]UZQ86187.1 toxic anion resistance protein [Thermoclostridium stercorarium]
METVTNSLTNTNTQAQEQVLDEMKIWQSLTPEEQQRVTEIKNAIDITDSQAILQYGVQAQSNISSFSDTVLSQIRAKDSGRVGDILTELMAKVNELNVDSLSQNDGLFGRMFGGVKSRAKKFIGQYEKISVHIDRIINELEKARMQLLKDIALLDGLYEKNIEYMRELDVYILAGSLKLSEINDKIIPELKKKAEESGDPTDAQRVKDMLSLANRFEKKLHDLKLSRMIAIQTAPQIRLIQSNDQVLVEKIQSSILNTIPLWKNQIIIAITLFRQEKALKLQSEVNRTTNELLTKNSELLKTNSIEVAKESEKGIVELETLKKVNRDLIETIEETLRIQKEGREKRMQVEAELKNMENELKQKLMEVKDI